VTATVVDGGTVVDVVVVVVVGAVVVLVVGVVVGSAVVVGKGAVADSAVRGEAGSASSDPVRASRPAMIAPADATITNSCTAARGCRRRRHDAVMYAAAV
jgi:hypothetical protein